MPSATVSLPLVFPVPLPTDHFSISQFLIIFIFSISHFFNFSIFQSPEVEGCDDEYLDDVSDEIAVPQIAGCRLRHQP